MYAYTSAVTTMPQWRGDVSEMEQLSDGPLGVGTRIRAGAKALGRPIGVVIEVTELELRGILGLLEPLMDRMVRRQYRANLGRLKAILEAQPTNGA